MLSKRMAGLDARRDSLEGNVAEHAKVAKTWSDRARAGLEFDCAGAKQRDMAQLPCATYAPTPPAARCVACHSASSAAPRAQPPSALSRNLSRLLAALHRTAPGSTWMSSATEAIGNQPSKAATSSTKSPRRGSPRKIAALIFLSWLS